MSDDFRNEHTSALGDPCTTRAEYQRRLKGFLARFEGLTYEPEEILVSGNKVAAAYVMRAVSEGWPIEIRGVMRMTVIDGLITHRIDYFDSLTYLNQTHQT